ncbi:MAG TPA: hypothetical protein VFM94_08560 [Solirubrobacterales bacterium]|nr:hypothetical protein [Solirubrobacterales bacterium]
MERRRLRFDRLQQLRSDPKPTVGRFDHEGDQTPPPPVAFEVRNCSKCGNTYDDPPVFGNHDTTLRILEPWFQAPSGGVGALLVAELLEELGHVRCVTEGTFTDAI